MLGISKREQGFISGGNIVVTGRSAIYSKPPALKPMVSSMAGHGVPMSCLCCLRHGNGRQGADKIAVHCYQ